MKSTVVRSTCCMLIHEYDIFYIDFIMITLVGLSYPITGSLIKLYSTSHIMVFFNLYLNKIYYQKCENKLFHFNNQYNYHVHSD